jgi:hypothetical protein
MSAIDIQAELFSFWPIRAMSLTLDLRIRFITTS